MDELKHPQIVYFELNDWFAGKDYPAEEPFLTWMGEETQISDEWAKENKLCIIEHLVDMSINFLITAPKDWVDNNCPKLLTDYTQFLRFPDEYGDVIGRFGHSFCEYTESNFGIKEEDNEDRYEF